MAYRWIGDDGSFSARRRRASESSELLLGQSGGLACAGASLFPVGCGYLRLDVFERGSQQLQNRERVSDRLSGHAKWRGSVRVDEDGAGLRGTGELRPDDVRFRY